MPARGYELDDAVRSLAETVRKLDLKTARVRLGEAGNVSYDPGTSGLTSTDVQDAIDELQAEIDALLPPLTNFLTNTYGEQATLITVSASGATYTIDCSLGNTFDITLTANCVLSISNPAPSGVDSHIVVILRQGGSGSYTVTWPGSVVWQDATDGTTGGSAPTLWTAVGAQDDFEFSSSDGGTTVGGSMTPHPAAAYTLTVDDEGTPLATGATSLDFVGAGVTASGSGAAKTITIPGGATASDTGIWRPLMDSGSGMVITDSLGEAVMGFGAA